MSTLCVAMWLPIYAMEVGEFHGISSGGEVPPSMSALARPGGGSNMRFSALCSGSLGVCVVLLRTCRSFFSGFR